MSSFCKCRMNEIPEHKVLKGGYVHHNLIELYHATYSNTRMNQDAVQLEHEKMLLMKQIALLFRKQGKPGC
jgi:hypothetical protein